MRALGVDLGSVRIGLALSDPSKSIASPFETLPAGDAVEADWPKQIAATLAEIAREQQADTIVIGLPRALSGGTTEGAARVRQVAAALAEVTTARVELWDERLSSVEAERLLVGAGQRRAARRTTRDRVAAAIILQSWLHARARRPDPEG